MPYTVYLGHKRTSLYIDECADCLANIVDNFKVGEDYNIAGLELHDMKTVSDLILNYLGKNDCLVRYLDEEKFTTKIKIPDISKAREDLRLNPKISLQQGIINTIEWMKRVYYHEPS